MSTTPTSERTSDVTKPVGRNRRWLWMLALIAVIAIAGIVFWLVFSGGEEEEEPTLTFDGVAATYTGPTTLEAGTNTFTLENTHDTAVVFAEILSTDENVTLDDVRVWSESDPSLTEPPPPWFGRWKVVGTVMAGQILDYTTTLSEGTYVLVIDDNFTQVTYPAAVIEVTAN